MGNVKPFRKGKVSPSPLDPVLMTAWNTGFSAGTKQQRELDIKNLAAMLCDLESISGIGAKRAWQIREHLMRKFE